MLISSRFCDVNAGEIYDAQPYDPVKNTDKELEAGPMSSLTKHWVAIGCLGRDSTGAWFDMASLSALFGAWHREFCASFDHHFWT
jgi:hypothetical protein